MNRLALTAKMKLLGVDSRQVVKAFSEGSLPGVELQPFRLGQFLGVIKSAPMLIMPATATNIVLHRNISPTPIFGNYLLYYHPVGMVTIIGHILALFYSQIKQAGVNGGYAVIIERGVNGGYAVIIERGMSLS
jgi:hypothetical protein